MTETEPMCQTEGCPNPADCAVRTYVSHKTDSLVTAVYQFIDAAPAAAIVYCVGCAQRLAFNMAGLSNAEEALRLPADL